MISYRIFSKRKTEITLMFVTIAQSRIAEEKKRIKKAEIQVREIKNKTTKPEKKLFLKTKL